MYLGNTGRKLFIAQGYNADLDNGVAEDLVPQGGDLSVPAAAAATTIVSSSANDAAAGTGARTVRVIGLDANYLLVEETASLNGTNAVTLANQYLRILDVRVLTAGSGLVNAGTVDVKHSATVLSQVPVGANRALQAFYCVPADYVRGHLVGLRASASCASAAFVTLDILVRPLSGLWTVEKRVILPSGIPVSLDLLQIYLAPKTDVKVRATSGVDNTVAEASLEFVMEK